MSIRTNHYVCSFLTMVDKFVWTTQMQLLSSTEVQYRIEMPPTTNNCCTAVRYGSITYENITIYGCK